MRAGRWVSHAARPADLLLCAGGSGSGVLRSAIDSRRGRCGRSRRRRCGGRSLVDPRHRLGAPALRPVLGRELVGGDQPRGIGGRGPSTAPRISGRGAGQAWLAARTPRGCRGTQRGADDLSDSAHVGVADLGQQGDARLPALWRLDRRTRATLTCGGDNFGSRNLSCRTALVALRENPSDV